MSKLAALALLAPLTAYAAPPHGITPDPAMAEYYHSLKVPGTTALCCTIADCRNVRARVRLDADGSYEAYIDSATFPDDDSPYHGHAPNAWVKVPEAVIIHDKPNLSGEPIACWYNGELRCFVPASGV